MRKIFITTFAILFSTCVFSQIKLGLKASPNFSWNRIDDASDSLSNKGVSLRMGGGAFVDYEFHDNYAFHSGLFYTTKGAGVKFSVKDTLGNISDSTIKMSLQYLQIPVAIKLFTNEISTDMRMYFEVGGTINTNLTAKFNGKKSFQNAKGEAVEYKKNISFFDFSSLISAGVEMQMGGETWVFGGITYNRGLLNANSNKGFKINGFQMYNEYLSIDLGLKF